MTVSIGKIVWPMAEEEAIRHYLDFLLLVLSKSQISFAGYFNDPQQTTMKYLNGDLSEHDREKLLDAWWSYLDERKLVRNFHDANALHARLAISLLSVKSKDAPKLGEHLSWFFETLEFLGIDLDVPIALMQKFFRFS